MATKNGSVKPVTVSDDGGFDIDTGDVIVCDDEPMTLSVCVERDRWDENGNRHRKGSILALPMVEALEGLANGLLSRHVAETDDATDERLCNRSNELVDRAFERARQPGDAARIVDFKAFKRWCDDDGLPALPLVPETALRYVLACGAADVSQSDLHRIIMSLARIHELTSEPPRGAVGRDLWETYVRALNLARSRLERESVPLIRHAELASAKAFELFPDGIVPRRFADAA